MCFWLAVYVGMSWLPPMGRWWLHNTITSCSCLTCSIFVERWALSVVNALSLHLVTFHCLSSSNWRICCGGTFTVFWIEIFKECMGYALDTFRGLAKRICWDQRADRSWGSYQEVWGVNKILRQLQKNIFGELEKAEFYCNRMNACNGFLSSLFFQGSLQCADLQVNRSSTPFEIFGETFSLVFLAVSIYAFFLHALTFWWCAICVHLALDGSFLSYQSFEAQFNEIWSNNLACLQEWGDRSMLATIALAAAQVMSMANSHIAHPATPLM